MARPKKQTSKTENIKCKFCNKEFIAYINEQARYCSSSCRSKDGNFGALEKHANWKGKEVGYWGIHKWIARNYKKPTTCESCGKKNLTGHKIHWANISEKYKRNRKDWKALCVKCHFHFDRRKRHISCRICKNKMHGIFQNNKRTCDDCQHKFILESSRRHREKKRALKLSTDYPQ